MAIRKHKRSNLCPPGQSLSERRNEAEKEILLSVLSLVDWHQGNTATRLFLSRPQISNLMKKHKIRKTDIASAEYIAAVLQNLRAPSEPRERAESTEDELYQR